MDTLTHLLGVGLDPKDLTSYQVCVRAVIIFFSALILMRVGHRRLLSRMSAFDVVLGVILASVLSRAVNGSARLGPTLAGGLAIVGCHWLLSIITYYSHSAGKILKGDAEVVVREGKPDAAKLRKYRISERDLSEEARLNGNVSDIGNIRLAVFERNGQISIMPSTDPS